MEQRSPSRLPPRPSEDDDRPVREAAGRRPPRPRQPVVVLLQRPRLLPPRSRRRLPRLRRIRWFHFQRHPEAGAQSSGRSHLHHLPPSHIAGGTERHYRVRPPRAARIGGAARRRGVGQRLRRDEDRALHHGRAVVRGELGSGHGEGDDVEGLGGGMWERSGWASLGGFGRDGNHEVDEE